MSSEINIVFMGTAEFAVPSLDALIKNGLSISAVVTAPDKPAGRGRKIKMSPVKEYALENSIPILQPVNLKSVKFLDTLIKIKPDLQIVVAFRMLPKVVWDLPRLGTFNLHSSLLPQYRGAAPINWAIINGEKETGVTTFFVDEKIDTGKVIIKEKVSINPHESAGELHDRLMLAGAELVVKTIEKIVKGDLSLDNQKDLMPTGNSLKIAPKIFKEDCRINWAQENTVVYNFIRGLSPYPTAFTQLISSEGKKYSIKIFKAEIAILDQNVKEAGTIYTDGKSELCIGTGNGWIRILEMQLEGKRRMTTKDFLLGFNFDKNWKLL